MTFPLYATAFGLTILMPLMAALHVPPRPDRPMLVVLPPWAQADRVIEAAGGRRIGPRTAPFASFAQSDDPAFIAKVHGLGAWAVRDATRLAQLCGTP